MGRAGNENWVSQGNFCQMDLDGVCKNLAGVCKFFTHSQLKTFNFKTELYTRALYSSLQYVEIFIQDACPV